MRASISNASWFGSTLIVLLGVGSAVAALPSDKLLPANTRGYLSVADVQELTTSWDQTQMGQLMQDPVMQPFSEDVKNQLKNRWTRINEKLGLTLDDLQGVPGGEVALALIQPAPDQAAVAIVVDVTGKLKEAEALLKKIHDNLVRQKSVPAESEVQGTRIVTYSLPDVENRRKGRKAIFFIRDNTLVGTDNPEIAQGILGRFTGDHKDNLASLEAYQAVMTRAEKSANGLAPQIRWFMDPFRYFETMRAAAPERERKRGKDLLRIFASQGFTAIQGIGGYVNFAVADRYEMLHQTVVYAPPLPNAPERYELAARILNFPNLESTALEPQTWVPRDLATYISFNVDTPKAFEASSTLVDELVGEKGVFEDVLKSIETDPNGPQINIRRDLVAHLKRRATMISDYHLPITTRAERVLFAIETSDETALAETVNRTMASDPDARRREFGGHVIWEIINAEDEMVQPQIEMPNFDPIAGGQQEEDRKRTRLPNSAVCVANGHMFIATHVDFLTQVLTPLPPRETLASAIDYQIITRELDKLMPGENSFRIFSRTDEEYRSTYELIRTGQMPQSQTLLGKLLNAILAEEEDELRVQRIDGKSLPDFEMVRRYFGPAGTKVHSEENGWFILGITVSKEVR